MGRRRKGSPPEYKRHKPSGLAYVFVGGERKYLGKHGTADSRRRYREFLREWEAGQSRPAPRHNGTLAELCQEYLDFALAEFRDEEGKSTTTYQTCRHLVTTLLAQNAATKADDFRARGLESVRDGWLKTCNRRTANAYASRVRAMFRWGVSKGLVAEETVVSLESLPDLSTRSGKARVPAVDDATVDATLPFLGRIPRAMVELQRLVGCRPAEVCAMRGDLIDREGVVRVWTRAGLRLVKVEGVWVYQPHQHKGNWRDKNLAYLIGPRAQAVLLPFLDGDPARPLFSPRQAKREFHEGLKTGNRPWTYKRVRGHGRDAYDSSTYGMAVWRACSRAFPVPAGSTAEETRAWRRAHWWSPNRLRHSAVTRYDELAGIQAASQVVGHASPDVTGIYAEANYRAAAKLVAEHG